MAPSMRRPLRLIAINLAVLAAFLVVGLSIAEVTARVARGRPLLLWMNFTEANLDFQRLVQPGRYDALLGWAPREDYVSSTNYWGIQIRTGKHGLRSTGEPQSSEPAPAILVVGDSFTFGDEVSDQESWPFILNGLIEEHVLNGGVFGYGIDQSYLRLTQLVKHYHPERIVFGFIAEDIARAQWSRRFGEKPFFSVRGDQVELRNVPVPRLPPEAIDLGLLAKILGHSFFLDGIVRRTSLVGYLYPEGHFKAKFEHNDGDTVACWIMDQLAVISSTGVEVSVLAQYTHEELGHATMPAAVSQVLTCARERGLRVIDLFSPLKEVGPARLKTFFNLEMSGHMSAAGNGFVAQQMAGHLRPRTQ